MITLLQQFLRKNTSSFFLRSCLPVFLIKIFLLGSLVTAVGGCGNTTSGPPAKKEPSLDSADPKERSEAARKAAEDFGAK
jgi:hypothetical protein